MREWEWRLLEDKEPLESVAVDGIDLRPGDHVRLRPRAGADIFDLALAGRTATIEAIEQDYDGRIQLAVIVDDDPGKDLGRLRQPGHQFFFLAEEVEPLLPSGMEPSGMEPSGMEPSGMEPSGMEEA
jgi:hypothetical protein